MIPWTLPRLEDFIGLDDFRRAFQNLFLPIIMLAKYIPLRGADGCDIGEYAPPSGRPNSGPHSVRLSTSYDCAECNQEKLSLQKTSGGPMGYGNSKSR